MRAKNLLFIISCFSLQAYSAVPVNSFEQLIDMSCKAHDMTANVRLQLDAARQRVENAEFNKWVPEVTVGVDVYAAFSPFRKARSKIPSSLTSIRKVRPGKVRWI